MTERRTEPSRSLLQGMVYTPSTHTNLRESFARLIAEQKKPENVQPLRKKR
jgi:hypothetical protein